MKTNVLQLIGSFHQGGSERQAVQLVRLLHEEKSCRVFVACLNKEGVLREEIERLGFMDFPEFPLVSFYDTNMFRQLRRCAEYLRENNITIIQSSDFYTNIFGMLAGAMAKTPVRIAAKRETGMKTIVQKIIERQAFRLSHAVVVNAEAVKNYLIASGVPRKKIATIYNGLDLSRLTISGEKTRGNILRKFDLPTDENMRFVTMAANLRSEVKNHRMFLRAAKTVKENFENVAFVLAGEGKLTKEIKEFAAELGLAGDTFFTGRCGQIGELLFVSDVCVLSSDSEGFSNSILEYMAAGKPVVATNVGGAAEAIVEGKTGFLVAPNDDEAMAKRLTAILENPENARKMGKAGKKIVEEKFSLHAQTEKTLALYENLLKSPRSRRK